MIMVPQTTSLAIQRGRAASIGIHDNVRELQARGKRVARVCISRETAADMRAFFAVAFAEFDNILPPRVLGVPLVEGAEDGVVLID